MQNDVVRFLDSINYKEEREELKNVEIEKVLLHQKEKYFEVILKDDVVLPYPTVKELAECSKNGIHGKEKCTITFHYLAVLEQDVLDYVKSMLKECTEKKPSLVTVQEHVPTITDDVITVECINKTVETELKKELRQIQKKLLEYGLGTYEFNTYLNEELQKSVQEEIRAIREEKQVIEEKPKIVGNLIFGREITGETTSINNIMGDTKGVVFEAYILGLKH